MVAATSDTRVFIVNLAGHDGFDKGEKWGKLVNISVGFVSFDSLDRLKYLAAEAVNKSDAEDWLLISGTAVFGCVCAITWFMKHKKCKMLIWDSKSTDYKELIILETGIIKLFEVLNENTTT